MAAGKLDLVFAENRAPRLVVNSTVSGVTANISIPNPILLPGISDVLQASPLVHLSRHLVASPLDGAKAHRRSEIDPADQGLLYFWFQDTLVTSVTLNFGAQASGYFWSRVAGLMIRNFHRILQVRHALFPYMDDLLILLEATNSPIRIGILTLTCWVLGIPMSWHQTAIGPAVTWIVWHINVHRRVAPITEDKRTNILTQIKPLLCSSRCDLKDLKSLTGRLLWASSLWETLRPLSGPLYHAMMLVPTTLVSISPAQWHELLELLTDDLVLQTSMQHPSLRATVRVVHAANFNLRDLLHVLVAFFALKAELFPGLPLCLLSKMLKHIFLGFRFLCRNTSKFGALLGQFTCAYCLDRPLRGRCHLVTATLACDNTSAEAAHLKVLSTSEGICYVLSTCFRFQRIPNLDNSIQHIPGVWNDAADALSRG